MGFNITSIAGGFVTTSHIKRNRASYTIYRAQRKMKMQDSLFKSYQEFQDGDSKVSQVPYT